MNQKPLIVLIAGPYRSGTNDDPALIAANLKTLESYALPIFRLGHIPLIGEWVALPIIREAGGKQIDDSIHQQLLYPVASRLLERCDAVLRVPGRIDGSRRGRAARQRARPSGVPPHRRPSRSRGTH
jgi:hypothetical protein